MANVIVDLRSVAEVVEREHLVRGQLIVNRDATDIDIAAKIVARGDPGRMVLVIINLGADAVFISPRGVASATNGIRLAATGGSFSTNWRDDLTLPCEEWSGASASDNNNILVLEWVML